ncbi:hypothetical protein AB6A40_004379 [Gnathostoma spinigerum]|uniref:Uncharacterized protein n=1 Tax=Gnathostoma spinigerum TaxID=75299 RepID=A0ABD6EN03_9BILA
MGRLSFVFVILTVLHSSVVFLRAHNHESPHYKYTREANDPANLEKLTSEEVEHGHSHEGGGCPYAGSHEHAAEHGHTHEKLSGHSHDRHDHSHEEHSHSHYHKHSHDVHGHSHEPHAQTVPSFQRSTVFSRQPMFDPKGYLSFLNNPVTRLWVYSTGSTLLISIAPFILLAVIPVQSNSAENESLLKVLLSFGSGGLLGDAFLHLIPHSQPASGERLNSHSHSYDQPGHSHGPHDMSVGSYVLAGIIAFLTVEKLVRIVRGDESGHGHSHGQTHENETSDEKKANEKKGFGNKKKAKRSDTSSQEDEVTSCDEAEELLTKKSQVGFKVAAYLNMAADFAHNFTDGLAIGASYLAGTTVGVVTMITVLVHEVPHEIGDFAILVQSGFSKKKAMFVQLLTALGALTGCCLSLWTADAAAIADAAASSWVLPFTAGGFIYIATVSVIPELLVKSSPWQSIKEILALLCGIFLMYLIALYE